MKRDDTAFTLIELLLVIAILTLLAGLVFAAAGPARESARQQVCISNLQQIGRAVVMYQNDNNGADATPGVAMTYDQLGLPSLSMFDAFANTYIKNRGVLLCPDYHGDIPIDKLFSTYNWAPDTDEGYPDSAKFSHIVEKRGGETPLMTDDQHNPPFSGREPRWFTKRVIVLRLNQQVQVNEVPVREDSADW